MDLGKTVMPAVIVGLKGFDQSIKDSEAQVRGFGGAMSGAWQRSQELGANTRPSRQRKPAA